jgi:selenocysteine lyase/cysteine desulfurase
VVFGQSATALTYLVSRALADDWRPVDEIVVSRLDHDANVRPWVQAAGRRGATVTVGGLRRRDRHAADRAVHRSSSANGPGRRGDRGQQRDRHLPDVPAIAAIAHEAGALVYVDGVHRTPHEPIDVAALGADFYVTSA